MGWGTHAARLRWCTSSGALREPFFGSFACFRRGGAFSRGRSPTVVAYQVAKARSDLALFLRSLADEPAGRVPR